MWSCIRLIVIRFKYGFEEREDPLTDMCVYRVLEDLVLAFI